MKKRSHGSTSVEFALIFLLFITVFMLVVDVSRLLFTWHRATEATLFGARYSAICSTQANAVSDKAFIVAKMQAWLPELTSNNVRIDWYNSNGVADASCTAVTTTGFQPCGGVRVSIVDFDYNWIIPLGPFANSFNVVGPAFSTYLPREIMGQDATAKAVACVTSP